MSMAWRCSVRISRLRRTTPIRARKEMLIEIDDAATGNKDSNWNVLAGSLRGDIRRVDYLAFPASQIAFGGYFGRYWRRLAQSGLAAIDLSSGQANSWDPEPTHSSRSRSPTAGNTVYVSDASEGCHLNNSGSMTIGGQTGHYIAAVDGTTGVATAWDPEPDGPGVLAMLPHGNRRCTWVVHLPTCRRYRIEPACVCCPG